MKYPGRIRINWPFVRERRHQEFAVRQAETAGDVYEMLGAECGLYEGDGGVHPNVPVADVRDRDFGQWTLWAPPDAIEGEHDEIEGSDEGALAVNTTDE